jgi:DnaJ like chaperone protein
MGCGCGCLFLIIFTLVGGSIGGPLGAIVAFLIGSFILSLFSNSPEKQNDNSDSFIVLFFSILGRMAKADGTVLQVEADIVKSIIDHFELQKRDRKLAVSVFNSAIKKNIDIYQMARNFTAENPDYNMRIILYRALWNVAVADNLLSEEEVNILKNILSSLNLPGSLFEIYAAEFGYFKQNYNNNRQNQNSRSSSSNSRRGNDRQNYQTRSSSLHADYEILGIPKDADVETIQKAYREKVREFHPDKIQAKGLPESFVKFAEEEMKKINESYSKIKKAKGF